MSDIAFHKIRIYEAPRYDKEDEETIAENEEIMVRYQRTLFCFNLPCSLVPFVSLQRKIPFAIVGSDTEVQTLDGRQVRGRQYPWGTIEVDNEDHCDFVKLRQMLVRTHMEELKEHTSHVLYENYRSDKLLSMGVTQDHSVFKEVKYVFLLNLCMFHAHGELTMLRTCCSPAAKMQEERALHEAKLSKMEAEMKMVFQQKVAEKEAKLKQSEEELYARHREMKDALEKQRFVVDLLSRP